MLTFFIGIRILYKNLSTHSKEMNIVITHEKTHSLRHYQPTHLITLSSSQLMDSKSGSKRNRKKQFSKLNSKSKRK